MDANHHHPVHRQHVQRCEALPAGAAVAYLDHHLDGLLLWGKSVPGDGVGGVQHQDVHWLVHQAAARPELITPPAGCTNMTAVSAAFTQAREDYTQVASAGKITAKGGQTLTIIMRVAQHVASAETNSGNAVVNE